MQNGEVVIATCNLHKVFKKTIAVANLNLEVQREDVFGFLGPNGAGKSTTIRMLLDLVHPTRGEVFLFGQSLKKHRHAILQRLGALVEKPDFYPYLSGRTNLKILADMMGIVKESHLDEVLQLVKLTKRADDKVKTYSHGMRQRLGIAQALLGNPELIILDEPTIGLDPQGMKEVRNLLIELSQRGITIFLSSHLLHEVEQICTHMAIIDKGKLIVQGKVDELLRQGPTIVRIQVDRLQEACQLLAQQTWIKKLEMDSSEIKVQLSYSEIPRLNRWLVEQQFQVYRLTPQTTLEDYYLSLVGEG